jgi:demethylmenaquinone methyltransferase/2-methoxy-6-polyprenyl-1,4-benzoquinol methylase
MPKQNETDPYAPFAGFYDLFLNPFLDPARKQVCQLASKYGLKHILDICCGTGRQCLLLSRQGIQATGLDISPSMLKTAQKKSPVTLSYLLADATKMPLAKNLFDAAVVSFALHEKSNPDQKSILQQAKRVIKPQGMLFLLDYEPIHNHKSKLLHSFIACIERIAGKEHFNYYRQFMAQEALQGLIKNSNFNCLQSYKYHLGTTGLRIVNIADSTSVDP